MLRAKQKWQLFLLALMATLSLLRLAASFETTRRQGGKLVLLQHSILDDDLDDDQDTTGSQQVAFKTTFELLPQETGHGHLSKYDAGYRAGHIDRKGHKSNQDYKSIDGYKGTKYGDYSKGHYDTHNDKGGKHYKGHDHKSGYYGDHYNGKKGAKGHLYGSKGHDNKGNRSNGYKNIWHLEEHGRQKQFYDDYDSKVYHNKYDDYDTYHEEYEDGQHKGEKNEGSKYHDAEGNKGFHEKGKYHDDHHGNKGSYGHKESYGKESDYGEKGGHKSSYGDGKHAGYGNDHGGYDGHAGHGSHSAQKPVTASPKEKSHEKLGEEDNNEVKYNKYLENAPSASKTLKATSKLEKHIREHLNNPTKDYVNYKKKHSPVKKNFVPIDLWQQEIDHKDFGRRLKPRNKPVYKPKRKSDIPEAHTESEGDNTHYTAEARKDYVHIIDTSDQMESRKHPKAIWKTASDPASSDKNVTEIEEDCNDDKNTADHSPTSERKLRNPGIRKLQKKVGDQQQLPTKSAEEDKDPKQGEHSSHQPSLIPIPILRYGQKKQPKHIKPAKRQQVSAVASGSLDTSETGKGKGPGKSSGRESGYHQETGGKGHKGGEKHEGYKGEHYGDHAKKGQSNYNDKGSEQYEGDDHSKHYKGEHNKGLQGKKGHHYGSKGHHNKGHKDKGFKNAHHKFEYAIRKKFYNDQDDKNFHKKYDEFDEFFKKFKEGNKKGGDFDPIRQNRNHNYYSKQGNNKFNENCNHKSCRGGYHKDSHGYKNYHHKGRHHDDKGGHKGHHGHKGFNNHNKSYGEKGGHKDYHDDHYGHGHHSLGYGNDGHNHGHHGHGGYGGHGHGHHRY